MGQYYSVFAKIATVIAAMHLPYSYIQLRTGLIFRSSIKRPSILIVIIFDLSLSLSLAMPSLFQLSKISSHLIK